MRKAVLLAFLLFVLVALPTIAQNQQWYEGRAIVDIEFEGLQAVAEEDLDDIVDAFVGDEFDDDTFNAIQRRLYALDYFTDLEAQAVRPADDEGMILRFHVRERPAIREIRFEGNEQIRASRLLDVIEASVGDLVIESELRRDRDALESHYEEEGYPGTDVQMELTDPDDENQQVVTFRVDETMRTTVREVRFDGNTFASAGTLRRQLETSEQSIFSRGVFKEGNLQRDRRNIERYYAERGYVDAEVADIEREEEVDEDRRRRYLTLTYYIEEGEQYTFGGFEFDGNEIFSDEQLRRATRLREGQTLNAVRLELDYDSILDIYREGGYLYNEIDLQEKRDEDERVISYTVNIVERGRARIENITVRGNERTRDHVVLREVPLEEGDVFSLTRLRQGMQNLANTQLFTDVQHEIPEGSVPGLLDLVLNVEEAPTTEIQFALSFGGAEGFPVSGSVGFQDRNFRGLGQDFGVNLEASPTNQSLSVNFLERWFMEERWSLGGDVTIDRAYRPEEPQDQLAPVFDRDEPNRVPDPFDGTFVFPEDTTYGGKEYQAGEAFPGEPTEEEIDEYGLETDYRHAGGRDAIPDDYLMEYTLWDVSIGARTGYRFPTRIGEFSLGTNFRSGVQYATYDDEIYRPFDPGLRDNLRRWRFVNRWGMNASLDNRDFRLSPSTGGLARQDLTFVGGFLGGRRHYIETETRLERFFTLWDRPMFEDWNFKGVLGMHSSLGIQWPTFFRYGDEDEYFNPGPEQLAIDGMRIARGWPRERGEAIWNNWLELRMPISEQILWFDLFADGVGLYEERADVLSPDIEDFRFTMGAGLRFTVPQFPIRLYLGKRARVRDGEIQWQGGNVFSREDEPDSGLDFIFTIGTELF